MKSYLLFIYFVVSTNLLAAQVWVGGGGDNLWNTAANWNTGSVPGPLDDATIPAPFAVQLDTPGADIKSLTIETGATLTLLAGTFIFNDYVTIQAGATMNFYRPITGGGTLTNDGTINLNNSNGTISSSVGATGTTLTNRGVINLNDIGDILLESDCVLNNDAGGIINLFVGATGISRSGSVPHTFNNAGKVVVRTPNQTDQVSINVQLINTGTIEVDTGVLFLDSDSLGSEFNGGMYDVFNGATLTFFDIIELSGTLAGSNDGTINLGNSLTVLTTATLNIGGSGVINFDPSIFGGGTLINSTTLTISGQPVFINDSSTFLNQGLIEFVGAGDIFVSTGSTLNNDSNGTIEFKGDTGNIQSGGGSPTTFLNSGLITTNFSGNGSDSAQISAELDNTGTIEISNGTLLLFNNNIQLNGGTYNIGTDGIFEVANTVTVNGSLSGTISGNGKFKWNGKINVPVAASFDFGGTGLIDWFSGNLDGGGILTNNNIINLGSAGNGFIFGGSTLVNNNTINFLSNDDLFIETNGTLNNEVNGDINFLADGASIGINGVAPRTFNNNGDIFVSLPNPDDNVTIVCEFNNNDSNIEIQQGVLNLSNGTKDAQNLIDGTYNIFADGAFDWEGNVTISGELAGTVFGPINWRSILWVNSPNAATFFFTGDPQINWVSGSLNGGGTLINSNSINHISNGNLRINGGTTLDNKGNFIFTTFGDLQLETNGAFNNLVDGTIEFQQPAANMSTTGAAPHSLTNAGTLIADTGGINAISINTTNTGLIDIRSGELEFNETFTLTNDTSGIIKGTGILDIPALANFTNNGTISPGASPGTLTVIGDYTSTSSSVLDIEIDGLTQGIDFDFMPITGDDVVFDGQVNVTLGYAASINDEFVISTTSGNIATCDIASTTTASFNGDSYQFDVICRNNNELVLLVTDILSIDDYEFNENTIRLYPNPANDVVVLNNNSNQDIMSYYIYDAMGRLITADLQNLGTNDISIDVKAFANGIYFMKVNGLNGRIIKTLIVKR